MAGKTSIAPAAPSVDAVNSQVRPGCYGSPSEVVQAGLLVLQEKEDRVLASKAALEAGEQSGRLEKFDNATFLREMRERHAG